MRPRCERRFSAGSAVVLLVVLLHGFPASAEEDSGLEIVRSVIHKGEFDEEVFVHSRAAMVPGPGPMLVLTTQRKITRGVDAFYSRYESTSSDHGGTWTALKEIPSTKRGTIDAAGDRAYADSTPQWHAKSGRVLSIGVIIPYGKVSPWNAERTDSETVYPDFGRPRKTAYMVRGSDGIWGRVRRLEVPDEFPDYHAPSSCQRVDLDNGNILQPLHAQRGDEVKHVLVVECRFDGKELRYLRHGNEIRLPGDGKAAWLAEPSLVRFADLYLLTIRNSKAAFVSASKDPFAFPPPTRWAWDDGEPLESRGTQQHWLTLGDRLYLVYTRRDETNGKIFNNRAPLYIAEVDPQRLRLKRATEQVVFPNKGYPLGNFGITQIDENQALVISTEWPRIEFTQAIAGAGNDILLATIRAAAP